MVDVAAVVVAGVVDVAAAVLIVVEVAVVVNDNGDDDDDGGGGGGGGGASDNSGSRAHKAPRKETARLTDHGTCPVSSYEQRFFVVLSPASAVPVLSLWPA